MQSLLHTKQSDLAARLCPLFFHILFISCVNLMTEQQNKKERGLRENVKYELQEGKVGVKGKIEMMAGNL